MRAKYQCSLKEAVAFSERATRGRDVNFGTLHNSAYWLKVLFALGKGQDAEAQDKIIELEERALSMILEQGVSLYQSRIAFVFSGLGRNIPPAGAQGTWPKRSCMFEGGT